MRELNPELGARLKRYQKRTGVFRVYEIDRTFNFSKLLIEFVIRGRVLATLPLRKRRIHES